MPASAVSPTVTSPRIASRVGSVDVAVEVSDEMMPGVVCLPHGWGHDAPGTRMSVASERPGVNLNVLTDGAVLDRPLRQRNAERDPRHRVCRRLIVDADGTCASSRALHRRQRSGPRVRRSGQRSSVTRWSVTSDARWVHMEPPPGLPVINLQRVPEAKASKNRLHLDVFVDDPAGVDRPRHRARCLSGAPSRRSRRLVLRDARPRRQRVLHLPRERTHLTVNAGQVRRQV